MPYLTRVAKVGRLATVPRRLRGPLHFKAGDQIRSGQMGYITPAVGGVPTASERGTKSQVAHKWAG